MRINARPAHQHLAGEPAYGDDQIDVLDTPGSKARLPLPRFDPVGLENQRTAEQVLEQRCSRQQVYVAAQYDIGLRLHCFAKDIQHVTSGASGQTLLNKFFWMQCET